MEEDEVKLGAHECAEQGPSDHRPRGIAIQGALLESASEHSGTDDHGQGDDHAVRRDREVPDAEQFRVHVRRRPQGSRAAASSSRAAARALMGLEGEVEPPDHAQIVGRDLH